MAQLDLTSGVSKKRKELRDVESDYRLILDCIDGERVVKRASTKYLPQPNSEDASKENSVRYDAYKKRAVFYNVTQRTLAGLVGEVFARDPVEKIPPGLDVVSQDANGSGLTLTQIAKRGVRFGLALGRGGVLADYPMVDQGATKADVETGLIQPTITIYSGIDVINWRTEVKKAKTYLTLIVLREKYDVEDDGFTVTQKEQYRVLKLIEGVYTVQIYRDGKPVYDIPAVPTKSDGKTFNYIPFTFIGSENNDPEVDHPPLLDLAILNIAHYRNSADYEEGVFMVGQPTPVFSGLTTEWVKEVMDGQVHLGSRGGVMLPAGGDSKLLQMEANSAAFEAMEHKERQMIALGAKLVEQKQVQRTATEANIENASETSVLSDVAKNVSSAIKFALEVCAEFNGDSPSGIEYTLNTDFNIASVTPQERQQIVAEWQQGAITWGEMRTALRKAGVATEKDDKAKSTIEQDMFSDVNNTNNQDPANQDPNNVDNGGSTNA